MELNIGIDIYNMLTFQQFLESRKLATGTFGMGTGQSPAKIMARGAIRPASPTHPKYHGLSVAKSYPVAKIGKVDA